jgi:hypothetical protein
MSTWVDPTVSVVPTIFILPTLVYPFMLDAQYAETERSNLGGENGRVRGEHIALRMTVGGLQAHVLGPGVSVPKGSQRVRASCRTRTGSTIPQSVCIRTLGQSASAPTFNSGHHLCDSATRTAVTKGWFRLSGQIAST